MATSNPGAASATTKNISPLRGVAITYEQFSNPTAELISDQTSIYQTPDGQLWKSDGATSLIPIASTTAAGDFVTLDFLSNSLSSLLTSAQARAGHTGNDPAANVVGVLPNGQMIDLQTWMTSVELRLTNPSATAPVNTVQPAAPTGTKSVGSTLTALNGTWTGASTYNYVWYRVNTTTGAFTATGGTAATYILQAADAGFNMAVSVAGVSSAGIAATPVLSAVTTTVGVTLPTISVAPAVTPSGSQAVGVLLTSTTGTWNNASGAVYTYQWTLNGSNITGATANTYTLISGQEGASVLCKVLATTSQGPAAAAASSNTITVASTPVLVFTAAPALPATVTAGTAATVTNATFTGGSATLVVTRFYLNAFTSPYASITANPAVYTPEIDSTSGLAALGLSTTIGATVYCDQQWLLNGTTYTSVKSVGRVVQAPSATLTASTQSSGLTWVQNTAITSVKPVSATGGTLPYSYAITPATTALPTGVTINTSTGFISGTPTVQTSLVTYSITVTDAAGASSASTFTGTVSPASVTALSAGTLNIPSPDPFGWTGIYELEAPNDSDGSGYSSKVYSNGQSVPPLSNVATVNRNGITRLGPITDSASGLPMMRHSCYPGDPLRHDSLRSEFAVDSVSIVMGVDYWMSIAYRLDSDFTKASSSGDDRQSILQVHQQVTSHNIGGPFGVIWRGSNSLGQEFEVFTTNSDTSSVTTRMRYGATPGAMQRLIVHYREGLAAGQAPKLEVWLANGTGTYNQLTDLAPGTLFGDSDTTNSNPNFPKTGFNKFGLSMGSRPKTAMNCTILYFGTGASLFNQAAAAVSAYAVA